MGVVRYRVIPGVPGGPDDADVAIVLDVTDVRCRGPFAGQYLPCGAPNRATEPPDYAGELRAAVNLRITDRDKRLTRRACDRLGHELLRLRAVL